MEFTPLQSCFPICKVEFFKQRETTTDEEQVSVVDVFNIGTNERCQSSFNPFRQSLQPLSRYGGLVGDIEWCEEAEWETRDFTEKYVEITVVEWKVKWSKVGESMKETKEERAGWIIDSEWESKIIDDRE